MLVMLLLLIDKNYVAYECAVFALKEHWKEDVHAHHGK